MTPLRIAYCLPNFMALHQITDGALAQQAYTVTGLRSRGHQLTFIALDTPTRVICTTDLRRPEPARVTWSDSFWFNAASKAIWRAQKALGVPYLNVFSNYRLYDACLQCLPGHDIVHERSSIYRVGVAMACKHLSLPYVLFFDADEIFENDFLGTPISGLVRRRAQQIVRHNLRAADQIICVSRPIQEHLAGAWRVPADKIRVLPNGVDVELYRPYPESRAVMRASLGLTDQPLVIFVGSFYRWHDVATLLSAFALLSQDLPDARLLLVGDGNDRNAMERLAGDLGLGSRAIFAGQVPHERVPHYISAADAAVAPYPKMDVEFWGSPTKLFEYMASGTGLVGTRVGQLAEIIEDGENGLLVPPADAPALATALERLLCDQELRQALGHQARSDAMQQHTWDQYVSRLEAVYEAALSGARR